MLSRSITKSLVSYVCTFMQTTLTMILLKKKIINNTAFVPNERIGFLSKKLTAKMRQVGRQGGCIFRGTGPDKSKRAKGFEHRPRSITTSNVTLPNRGLNLTAVRTIIFRSQIRNKGREYNRVLL